jgi:acyl-CoA thioesterase-1
MVTLSTAIGAKVLLLGMRMPPNYGPEYTKQFALVFSDLASEKKISSVPFLLNDVALSPNLLQGDDIHPNALGQPILLDNVWPALKPLLHK